MASTTTAQGFADKDPSLIPAPQPPNQSPSETDLAEQRWWQDQRHREQRWLHHARIWFAPAIFFMLCIWLVAVLAILIFDGFGVSARWLGGSRPFQLPDGVMYALLGATTVGVIGLFSAVAKHLFPGSEAKKQA